ncbi:hypothetical protein FBALC1_02892 [Flavobacteriales bacterium ALC-1]|nr:hypothetical protein FBALC1_02892 [Flavobacteriales bacterium ALC-1]
MYTEKDKRIFDKIVKQLNENAEKKKTKVSISELNSHNQIDKSIKN